jgi:hypothetical protein
MMGAGVRYRGEPIPAGTGTINDSRGKPDGTTKTGSGSERAGRR